MYVMGISHNTRQMQMRHIGDWFQVKSCRAAARAVFPGRVSGRYRVQRGDLSLARLDQLNVGEKTMETKERVNRAMPSH